MMITIQKSYKSGPHRNWAIYCLSTMAICCLFGMFHLWGADKKTEDNSNENLLEELIRSKADQKIIVFDHSVIKQYWIDKSVADVDNKISIALYENKTHSLESVPLKIQLANVIETQDCKIEIITEDDDIAFSVLNDKSKALSTSSKEEDFIHYHVLSSLFHLEDTNDFSFSVKFSSKNKPTIDIKKIILSFSQNSNSKYLGSTGFNQLLEQFSIEGKDVPNSDVQYILSQKHNKIFFKVPTELAFTYRFLLHIYPDEPKDFLPNRAQYGFNNHDFNLRDRAYTQIPKPYNSTSEYTLLQIAFPPFPCTLIRIGQYDSNKRLWALNLDKSFFE